MPKSSIFTKVLAVVGLIFAWLPLVAPVLLTGLVFILEGELLFDWLMPAELFLLGLTGGFLLMWAAVRMRARWVPFAWGMAGMIVGLMATQGLAVLTGLAHGDAEPEGWRLVLVLSMLGFYTVSLAFVAVRGVILFRQKPVAVSAPPCKMAADEDE